MDLSVTSKASTTGIAFVQKAYSRIFVCKKAARKSSLFFVPESLATLVFDRILEGTGYVESLNCLRFVAIGAYRTYMQ